MVRLANRLLQGAALAVALTALARAQAVAPRQCGYDRWPVKTLADKDRNRVSFTSVETTVAKLAGIPIHEIPYPSDRRIEPEELEVYRVRAMLVDVRREEDSDLHLIIADLDNPAVRMIAEIPAPECTNGTGNEEAYRRARAMIIGVPKGTRIELVGVGFFDFLHDVRGGAKNGIELHPVLDVRRVD
jgi:hypothetical protein